MVDHVTSGRSEGTVGSKERSTQTLPIPLGGLAPAHRHPTVLRRAVHRHRAAPLMALALAAAGGGVWLSTSARSYDAGEDGRGVHVDTITLEPEAQSLAGIRVFTGAATLVIAVTLPGIVRAGAVTIWNGAAATGRCVLVNSAASVRETCQFHIGTSQFTSTDTFAVGTKTWHRRYSDGVEITMTVPTGSTVIPIPFPLGR